MGYTTGRAAASRCATSYEAWTLELMLAVGEALRPMLYRIEILHISIISKFRSFNLQGDNTFDTLREAAVFLFGFPFVKEDFLYEQVSDNPVKGYRVFHRRMEALFGTFTIERLEG